MRQNNFYEPLDFSACANEVRRELTRLRSKLRDEEVPLWQVALYGIHEHAGGYWINLANLLAKNCLGNPPICGAVNYAAGITGDTLKWYCGCVFGRTVLEAFQKVESDDIILIANKNILGRIVVPQSWQDFSKKSLWSKLGKLLSEGSTEAFEYQIYDGEKPLARFQLPDHIDRSDALFSLEMTNGQIWPLPGSSRVGHDISERTGDPIICDRLLPANSADFPETQNQIYALTNILMRVHFLTLDR